MARPNSSTQTPSQYQWLTESGSSGPIGVADGWKSVETVTGTNRKKPAGWVPPTGYTLNVVEYRRAHGSTYAKYLKGPAFQLYEGCVGSGRFNSLNHFNELLLETEMLDSTLLNSALIKARGKLKSSSVNLGVAWAERSRTAHLVGDTAIRLAKSVVLLKRGSVRRAMDNLGISSSKRQPRGSNVPKKWLELQYGWKPLLSDVYGACDALSKRHKSDWRITAKSSASQTETRLKTWRLGEAGYGAVTVERRAFVRIDALPYNEALISLASLGVLNPLMVGWELVPFSFVVDWFLPVGNYLDGLDAMLGYDAANTYTSQTNFAKAKWEERGRVYTEADWLYQNNYLGYKRVVKMTRSVTNGVPLAKPPWVKNPVSLGHMANGLALLSQAFGRRR